MAGEEQDQRQTGRKTLRRLARHPIVHNAAGLYMIQIATFVVPLITLPYVARVLHPSGYGLVVFSQGFSFVLTAVIDWAFTYDGVRTVSAARGDPARMNVVVSHLRGGQLLLCAGSVPVALAALLVVPVFDRHPVFLLLAWAAALTTGLAPNWYFTGIEKLRLAALTTLAYRVIAAGLTFLLVHNPSEAWIVMVLFAGASVVTLVALDLRMYRQVALMRPTLRESFAAIRSSTVLFIGTLALSLYTSLNVVLLGLFKPTSSVARFGASERVVRVAFQVLGPLGGAVYPRLTALQAAQRQERARRLLLITIAGAGLLALAVALVLVLAAPLIVRLLYGSAYVHGAVPVLRILALIVPINVLGSAGGTWLMTLHMDRRIVTVVAGAGVLNVILACLLTPAFGLIGMAWSVVCAESAAAVGLLMAALRPLRLDRGDAMSIPDGLEN